MRAGVDFCDNVAAVDVLLVAATIVVDETFISVLSVIDST
jgi:hypothetical protein